MKITTTVIILFVAFVANAEDLKLPHVSVFGTAEIKVVPDEMIWNLSVQTKGNDVGQVAEVHDQKVALVIKFLQERQIKDEEIQTSRIQLSENWVRRGQDRVKEGYIAATQISFKSGDLEQYRTIWTGIAKIQDVSVNGVSFDTSKRIMHQNESRLKAVKAAKEKAEALAKALGSTIHEPLVIEEEPALGPGAFNTRNLNVFAQAGQGANGTSIAPGTIPVTTRVKVKFRISSN